MEYTAAGIATVALDITVSAIVIASVLLWMPISNAQALACALLMFNMRGMKYPMHRLQMQKIAVAAPT